MRAWAAALILLMSMTAGVPPAMAAPVAPSVDAPAPVPLGAHRHRLLGSDP